MPRTSRESRNAYMRDMQRRRHARRRADLIALLGGRCISCGSTERLEFDHVDRSTKSFTIADRLNTAWATLVAEAAKCQLLCHTCHQAKTHTERAGVITAVHGSVTMYMNHGCRCEPCRLARSENRRALRGAA